MKTLFVYRSSFRTIDIINHDISFIRSVNLLGINYRFTKGADCGLESVREHMVSHLSKINVSIRTCSKAAKLLGSLLLC